MTHKALSRGLGINTNKAWSLSSQLDLFIYLFIYLFFAAGFIYLFFTAEFIELLLVQRSVSTFAFNVI